MVRGRFRQWRSIPGYVHARRPPRGRGPVVRLASNENPLGPSPRVAGALRRAAGEAHLYPDPSCRELRKALAGRLRVPGGCVALGAGTDAVIEGLLKVLVEPRGEVVIPTPTFTYYEVATRLLGGVPRFVPRTPRGEVDPEGVLEAVNRRTRAIFLCAPNNPTGNGMAPEAIRRVQREVPGVAVIVDEAYGEFASTTALPLFRPDSSLIVLRTFSKAYGLAGLRVGYGVVPRELASPLAIAMSPFPVSTPAQRGALAALRDPAHLERTVALVRREREWLRENLPYPAYPSEANFLAINTRPRAASGVVRALEKRGILVRDCSTFRGAYRGLVRITVGTRPQNQRVVRALRSLAKRG
ncbi:MAG: histidinol-phosphate transaminase [Euryarchaeota archaeon]|nr:histidinol-phosphate transaminase [Euryarchaeota archaeon]